MAIILNRISEGKHSFFAENPDGGSLDELLVYANTERKARSIIREAYGLSRLPPWFTISKDINPFETRHHIARHSKGSDYIDGY